jgi:hypothetical protein
MADAREGEHSFQRLPMRMTQSLMILLGPTWNWKSAVSRQTETYFDSLPWFAPGFPAASFGSLDPHHQNSFPQTSDNTIGETDLPNDIEEVPSIVPWFCRWSSTHFLGGKRIVSHWKGFLLALMPHSEQTTRFENQHWCLW